MIRYLNLKERFEVTRVCVAIFCIVIAAIGALLKGDGWIWFLLSGVIIYPSQITIDLRERNDE